MHIEKRKAEINKTYRETKHELESVEGAALELEALYERIENKISELSSFLRNIKDAQVSKEAAEEMNRLKLQRKHIKEARKRVQKLDRQEWFQFREEIQDTFEKAQKEVLLAHSIIKE